MKEKILFILTILTSVTFFAQRATYSNIGATVGYVENGYGLQGVYDYSLDDKKAIQGVVHYSNSTLTGIPVEYFGINGNLLFKAFYDRYLYETFIGIGFNTGYESINAAQMSLDNGSVINSQSNWIYGAQLSFQGEYYITDRIGGYITFVQYYHKNSDLGDFTPYIGAGIKYLLFN